GSLSASPSSACGPAEERRTGPGGRRNGHSRRVASSRGRYIDASAGRAWRPRPTDRLRLRRSGAVPRSAPQALAHRPGAGAVGTRFVVCPHCQQGQSPRDRELDVEGTEGSPAVRRMTALVGAETSFDKRWEQLDLLAGIEVTAKAVERHAEAIGADTPRPGRGSSPTTGRSSSPRISRSSFGSKVRRTSGLRRSTRNRTGKSSAGP